MTVQHTHYDNLKVARNAPPEVIRAAYKSLAQKYHPDKYHDPVEAERIIKIINGAYEVLMDPEARAKYDIELGKQEVLRPTSNHHTSPSTTVAEAVAAKTPPPKSYSQNNSAPFSNEDHFVNLKKTVLTIIFYGATIIALALVAIKLTQAPPLKSELSSNNNISDKIQAPLEQQPLPNIEPTNSYNTILPTPTITRPLNTAASLPSQQNTSSSTATGQIMRSPTKVDSSKPQTSQTNSYEDAEKMFRENRFIEAETMVDLLLTQSPNNSKTWRLKGMLQASRGNIGAATKAFGTYLQTSDNSEKAITALENLSSGKNNVALGIQQAAHQALSNIGKE